MKLASIGGLTLLLATFACRDVSTDLARRDAIDATPMFAAAATPTTVFRFMSRGDFGSVSWNSNSQFGFANISTGDTLGLFYQVASSTHVARSQPDLVPFPRVTSRGAA